jgi:hypothetical protein
MAQLWVDPGPAPRDLRAGPHLPAAPPPPPARDARFEVLDEDPSGFSITYRVRDQQGHEWNVKIGPEAGPEVVTSRIVWALGYHELPSYFVERWIAVDHAKGQVRGGARFRPRALRVESRGAWSWQRNPFVGTRPFNGLIALMVMLNSTDLKNDNNALYDLPAAQEGARRWYVVKDLGASLGETGAIDPRRGYIDGFERERFIVGRDGPRVLFGFRGRHRELLEHIEAADVRWICERLQKISDRQLRDAFHAGNFGPEETDRYVKRIREKVREGLALR